MGIPFFIALSRNAGCDYEALANLQPPYGGEILPGEFVMIEQQNWFQVTKIVDVFDPNLGNKRVGYFYDMQFLFFMRFGFSDAEDRVWFEASYPSFMSRFHPALEYALERCDVGVGARRGAIYDVMEDWWARPWYCGTSCRKVFHVSRRPAEGGVDEPVANVEFDSSLGLVRPLWYMNMTDVHDHSTLSYAQQQISFGGLTGLSMLSNWSVQVNRPTVPNWVVGFTAAVDDLVETDH